MKTGLIRTLLSLLTIALFVTGCDDESGSRLPSVRMDMVVADVDFDGHVNTILVDNGTNLFVKQNRRGPFQNIQDERIRAIAYYEPLYTSEEAVIYDIAPVQVIVPVSPNEAGIHQQDPVQMVRAWPGGGFLNIELSIKTLNLAKHKLAFVDDSAAMYPGGVFLELFHQGDGDSVAISKNILVSIPLAIYYERFNNQGFDIVFAVNTKEGFKHYKINIESL